MRYIRLLIWTLVVAYLCFAPADEFDGIHISIPNFDKIVHFGMFGIMGFLISGIKEHSDSVFDKLWLPVFAVIYGGVIEIVQLLYINQRSGDIFDWGADIIGLIAGLTIFYIVPDFIKRLAR